MQKAFVAHTLVLFMIAGSAVAQTKDSHKSGAGMHDRTVADKTAIDNQKREASAKDKRDFEEKLKAREAKQEARDKKK